MKIMDVTNDNDRIIKRLQEALPSAFQSEVSVNQNIEKLFCFLSLLLLYKAL